MAHLPESVRSGVRSLVTMSAGNYGKAFAYACQRRGLKGTVVMPETAPDSRQVLIEVGETFKIYPVAMKQLFLTFPTPGLPIPKGVGFGPLFAQLTKLEVHDENAMTIVSRRMRRHKGFPFADPEIIHRGPVRNHCHKGTRSYRGAKTAT